MVKVVIACSDIHIRNIRRIDEISEVLDKFIEECRKIVSQYNYGEVRIVIAGDIFHNKIEISNEASTLCGWFLRELENIGNGVKVIVIAGNHDHIMQNNQRLDSITPIFSLSNFKNCIYVDKELEYSSGCFVDENIVWCLYSTFDNFNSPDIIGTRNEYPEKTFIGLFHGDLNGSQTDTGYVTDNGLDASYFKDLDFVIMGHIHKRQCIKKNGVQMVYCGSLYQQDMGETITEHGYVIWNIENKTYTEHNIDNSDYGFYQFSINDYDDIENNKEELINL